MTQDNKSSQGSDSLDRFSGKRDHRAGAEDKAPFKKRVRFFSSDDLKKVAINNMTQGSSGANKFDVKVTDGGEKNKMKSIPIHEKKRASLSQLKISESGVTGKETKELIKGIQEAAMKDGSGGSSARGGEEQSKGDICYRRRRRRSKKRRSRDGKPIVQEADQGGSDKSGDGRQDAAAISEENPIQKTEGGSGDSRLPTDHTAFESRVDRSGEGVRIAETDLFQQLMVTLLEDGEISVDVVGEEENIPEAEENPIQNTEGGSGDARLPTAFEIRVDRSVEDECGEGVQIAEIEDGEIIDDYVVGEEENIPEAEQGAELQDGGDEIWSPIRYPIRLPSEFEAHKEAAVKDGGDGSGAPRNNKLVEEGEPEMIQDGDAHGEEETYTIIDSGNVSGNGEGDGEQQQGKHVALEDDGFGNNSNSAPGSEEPMEDGGNESFRNTETGVEEQSNKGKEPMDADDDHHEQGQQRTAVAEGGDGNAADVIVSGEEVQDKKGKRPAEDVAARKDHNSNQIATDVVVIVSDDEGDDNDQIQQKAAFEDPDANMAIPGDNDMETQQDPMTEMDSRKRTRSSIYEHGEVSQVVDQRARKKYKYIHVFPCGEEEPDHDGLEIRAGRGEFIIAIGPPRMQQQQQQPADGFYLFGVYITGQQVQRRIRLFGAYIGVEEQVQEVERQNRDGGNSHGSGESSITVQPPRCGIRLFGHDI